MIFPWCPDPKRELPYELAMEFRFKNAGEARPFESLLETRLKLTPLPDGCLLGQIFLVRRRDCKKQQGSNLDGPLLRIRFRNFIGVLTDLTNGVEVPPSGAQQGIVQRVATAADDPSLGPGHIIVHCGAAFPGKTLWWPSGIAAIVFTWPITISFPREPSPSYRHSWHSSLAKRSLRRRC